MGAADSTETFTTYSKAISAGNEGKTYRFRVAAQNVLGIGPYSDEIQLVATDAPGEPYIQTDEDSRTLTSIQLDFTKPDSDGGSTISGYQLWRYQGYSGSPFTLIYNGTNRPE